MTKEEFQKHAMALYDFWEYPAVRYKILFSLLDTPYDDKSLTEIRKDFRYFLSHISCFLCGYLEYTSIENSMELKFKYKNTYFF